MQYWTEPYKEIASKIKANLPQIQWIDLWHEQVSYLTTELPFPVPAVFIAFNMLEVTDRGLLVQDCNTQVDIYFFYETFSDTYDGSYNQTTALEYLERLTELHALFHGKAGRSYSEMRRVDMRREDSGGAGNLYRISFQCLVTDTSAATLYIESQNPEAEVEVKSEASPAKNNGEPLFVM